MWFFTQFLSLLNTSYFSTIKYSHRKQCLCFFALVLFTPFLLSLYCMTSRSLWLTCYISHLTFCEKALGWKRFEIFYEVNFQLSCKHFNGFCCIWCMEKISFGDYALWIVKPKPDHFFYYSRLNKFNPWFFATCIRGNGAIFPARVQFHFSFPTWQGLSKRAWRLHIT